MWVLNASSIHARNDYASIQPDFHLYTGLRRGGAGPPAGVSRIEN
jgi:hypothetical protein